MTDALTFPLYSVVTNSTRYGTLSDFLQNKMLCCKDKTNE